MGEIYTSYFGNARNFPARTVPIGITRYKPAYWDGINIEDLAPSTNLLKKYKNKEIDEFIFEILYIEELKERGYDNPEKLKRVFQNLTSLYNVVLCCYEKPGEFCHRHVLAKWLGEDIIELSTGTEN